MDTLFLTQITINCDCRLTFQGCMCVDGVLTTIRQMSAFNPHNEFGSSSTQTFHCDANWFHARTMISLHLKQFLHITQIRWKFIVTSVWQMFNTLRHSISHRLKFKMTKCYPQRYPQMDTRTHWKWLIVCGSQCLYGLYSLYICGFEKCIVGESVMSVHDHGHDDDNERRTTL